MLHKTVFFPVLLLTLVPGAVAQTFLDVTEVVGIEPGHDIGSVCEPPISNGSAWADYDDDGDLDLYVTNHGGANRLYRNDGDGDADGLPEFANAAPGLGLEAELEVSMAAVFVDYDNDGDQDLYVTHWGGNALYQNQLVETGLVEFLDVTAAAGVADFGRGITVAWADFDNDSYLDLYIAKHRECTNFDNNVDGFYRNNGDGTFTDVLDWLCAGAACDALQQGLGFSPGWLDYDDDGDLDLYLVNDDLAVGEYYHNVLWRNDGSDGSGGWIFTDVSAASGADKGVNGMGLGVSDYNNDGWLDIAFSNIGPNSLLENQGDGTFLDVSAAAGIERSLTPGGDQSVTWGTVFLDYDNDGWLDLYFVAGYTGSGSIAPQPNAFFHNNGDGTFLDVSAGSGTDHDGRGRSASMADFDGDGFVDLFVGNYGEPPLLLHNSSLALGNENHWLAVTVEGTESNRDGIGARLWLSTPDGTTQMREISSGPTHGGGDHRAAYFGLGANETGDLLVRWPSGVVQDFGTLAADQYFHAVEEAPAGGLVITGPDPGLAGETNSFNVTGAGADQMVFLVAGMEAGSFEIPGCDGVEMEIGSPRIRDRQEADASGNVTLETTVPFGLAGDTLYFQALERDTCTVSNLITYTFPQAGGLRPASSPGHQ